MHCRVKVRLFPHIFGAFLGSESNLQAAPPLASEVGHSMSRRLTLVTITSAHAWTVNGAGRNRASSGRSTVLWTGATVLSRSYRGEEEEGATVPDRLEKERDTVFGRE